MKTFDLKKQYKYLYAPSAKKAEIVQVPRLQFLMFDGAIEKGREPGNSPGFQEAIQALYGMAYTLKFMLKKRAKNPVDYPVMPLEGLWDLKDSRSGFLVKDNWLYRLIILQPDVITQAVFEQGLAEVRRKRGDSPALSHLRLDHFEEGLCIQMMHVGPYAAEPATVELMQSYAADNGLQDLVGPHGKHHEIYVGDLRRANPAKLKTILRHPVERVG